MDGYMLIDSADVDCAECRMVQKIHWSVWVRLGEQGSALYASHDRQVSEHPVHHSLLYIGCRSNSFPPSGVHYEQMRFCKRGVCVCSFIPRSTSNVLSMSDVLLTNSRCKHVNTESQLSQTTILLVFVPGRGVMCTILKKNHSDVFRVISGP